MSLPSTASACSRVSWELPLRGAFPDVDFLSARGGEFTSFWTSPAISVFFHSVTAEKPFGVILFVCSNPMISENYYIMFLHL